MADHSMFLFFSPDLFVLFFICFQFEGQFGRFYCLIIEPGQRQADMNGFASFCPPMHSSSLIYLFILPWVIIRGRKLNGAVVGLLSVMN